MTAARGKGRNERGATLGHEAQLWQIADALRGSMDPAEYRHLLRLRFPKCTSLPVGEEQPGLQADRGQGAQP
ncbi:MAG TPA: hypothetical protein PLC08_00055 [Candidatus Bipolaricaulis sp.]|nr:hypothetical protein [Candidatus Bipolaricaulis sp.]HRS14580.1 hypothetical protein [Candidatus Bipolaricaulis sp.]HRU21662.1 hypothetical protein [Candidatus Bipolaricaulis sp.]